MLVLFGLVALEHTSPALARKLRTLLEHVRTQEVKARSLNRGVSLCRQSEHPKP